MKSSHSPSPGALTRLRGFNLAVLVWIAPVLTAPFAGACESEAQSAAAVDVADVSKPAQEPVVTEAEVAKKGRGLSGPPTDLVVPEQGEKRFVGVVDKALTAGSYTYLKVSTEQTSSLWVVTMSRKIEAGASVEVTSMGTRQDFYSRRLDRSFDTLVFGMVRTLG